MIRSLMFCLTVAAGSAQAEGALSGLINATNQQFAGLPNVTTVEDIGSVCGGGADELGVYCPSERQIYFGRADADAPDTLAHLYGHAMQVTYGVADIALAAIRADRPREGELRGMVTRQVECVAGVLLANAGYARPYLNALFDHRPLTGSHWGANPVRNGPQVSIGTDARAEWLGVGYSARHPEVCSVGEMSADLIVRNFNG